MPGVKGMKWSIDRPPKKVPCSTALRPYLYYKIKQLSRTKRWPVSVSIEYIIEQYYKDEYFKEQETISKELEKTISEELEKVYSSIPQNLWGVHIRHCCTEHGCKYGDTDCPVVLNLIKQDCPCEECEK